MSDEAYIYEAIRTPRGRGKKGSLYATKPVDLVVGLIDGQIGFVVDDRDVAQVYFREIANLPEADRRSLRRKQRLYLEEWVHLLTELRGDLDDTAARAVVHCAIGAIQSTLQHSAGLPEDRQRELLRRSALAVLTAEPSPEQRG